MKNQDNIRNEDNIKKKDDIKNCTTGSYVAACVPVLCLHMYVCRAMQRNLSLIIQLFLSTFGNEVFDEMKIGFFAWLYKHIYMFNQRTRQYAATYDRVLQFLAWGVHDSGQESIISTNNPVNNFILHMIEPQLEKQFEGENIY